MTELGETIESLLKSEGPVELSSSPKYFELKEGTYLIGRKPPNSEAESMIKEGAEKAGMKRIPLTTKGKGVPQLSREQIFFTTGETTDKTDFVSVTNRGKNPVVYLHDEAGAKPPVRLERGESSGRIAPRNLKILLPANDKETIALKLHGFGGGSCRVSLSLNQEKFPSSATQSKGVNL